MSGYETLQVPSLLVTQKLQILLVPSTALSSRLFFSRFLAASGAYKRGRLSDGYITINLNKTVRHLLIIAADTIQLCINQYSLRYILVITEYLNYHNKNAHSHADWSLCPWINQSFVHDTEECSSPASARGPTSCWIRFCFGIARVWDHSLWYGDKVVAQLNGCANSTSQAKAYGMTTN